jgi:hypothetical protein
MDPIVLDYLLQLGLGLAWLAYSALPYAGLILLIALLLYAIWKLTEDQWESGDTTAPSRRQ